MDDKEGAMKWVDKWLEKHGPEKKYFGFKGIDWERDVGYNVNAEEETRENRTAKSSRTRPKKGVWIIQLKQGTVKGTPITFEVTFEMLLDKEDEDGPHWAGNEIGWELLGDPNGPWRKKWDEGRMDGVRQEASEVGTDDDDDPSKRVADIPDDADEDIVIDNTPKKQEGKKRGGKEAQEAKKEKAVKRKASVQKEMEAVPDIPPEQRLAGAGGLPPPPAGTTNRDTTGGGGGSKNADVEGKTKLTQKRLRRGNQCIDAGRVEVD